MPVMNRRVAICASGVAIATPLAAKLLVKSAYGGESAAGGTAPSVATPNFGANVLNSDLQAYAVRNVPGFLAKARQGSLSTQDFRNLSSHFRLFARHIESIDSEPFRANVISSSDTSSTIDLSQRESAGKFYSKLLEHDPVLSTSEFQKSLTFSPEQLAAGKRALAANSIPWHFHNLADGLKWLGLQKEHGTQFDAAPFTHTALHSEVSSRLLSDAVYHPEAGAHLRFVANTFCGLTAKQWCQVAVLIVGTGIGIALILSGLPAGAAAVTSIATALGWSEAAVLAAVKTAALVAGFIGSLCSIFLS